MQIIFTQDLFVQVNRALAHNRDQKQGCKPSSTFPTAP